MTLRLCIATEADALCIGDIHMAAFATNGMLHAQFPTPSSREGLRDTVADKATEDIRDPHTMVLIVKDTQVCNEVITYGKWSLPTSTSANEAPWIWPEGIRLDLLEEWIGNVESVKDRVFKHQSCCRTSFLRVSPRVSDPELGFVSKLVAGCSH